MCHILFCWRKWLLCKPEMHTNIIFKPVKSQLTTKRGWDISLTNNLENHWDIWKVQKLDNKNTFLWKNLNYFKWKPRNSQDNCYFLLLSNCCNLYRKSCMMMALDVFCCFYFIFFIVNFWLFFVCKILFHLKLSICILY